ncbi:MAG: demethylmenaquinone methyltransferase [Bifidobacteriaceae bacterium]|nr:demethylmenaquinone methyltransferase [Bifidobacteriaceae bacterium]
MTADLDKDPSAVARMFDAVAARYDLTNNVLSLGAVLAWRRAVVSALDIVPGDRILDLAAGTGTSSRALADAGADVVAADFSRGMVFEGARAGVPARFVVADAQALPFADGAFDAVTISFGLRNVHDTPAALAEMARVTRPGGRLLIAEFSHPSSAVFGALYSLYHRFAFPVLARLVSSDPDAYGYLTKSIEAWPDQVALAALIREAGWEHVAYRDLTGGIVALHRAYKPV